jgi:hypothetical protein
VPRSVVDASSRLAPRRKRAVPLERRNTRRERLRCEAPDFVACRRPADGKDLSHARLSPRGVHDARLGALSGWRRAGRVAVGRARAVTRKHASFGDGGARRTFGTSRASRDPAKLPSPIAAGASRRALPRGFSSRSSSGSHCPGNAPSTPGVGWGIARLDADAGDARTRGEVRMRPDVRVATRTMKLPRKSAFGYLARRNRMRFSLTFVPKNENLESCVWPFHVPGRKRAISVSTGSFRTPTRSVSLHFR